MDILTAKNRAAGGYVVNGARFVPDDPANKDYQAVQRWISRGNAPAAADPAPPFIPSKREILLEALTVKTGVTAAELAAARAALINKGGR